MHYLADECEAIHTCPKINGLKQPRRDRDETLLQNKGATETRLDLLNKEIRDRDKTRVRFYHETESLGLFSLETETRPRVLPFSVSKKSK